MEDVKTRKGETRVFIDSGTFVRYGYEKDGRREKKVKLVLKDGKREEFFMIPLKDGKFLLVPAEAYPKKVLAGSEIIEV
ncbi:MAG: hypothetical protein GXO63_02650 [Candidatus Micrarchaeota archaeon]|nr:hypothetical protein [Candidatus Micrarchaeota archaeon]